MTLLGRFAKTFTVAWENITGKPTIPDVSDFYTKAQVDATISEIELLPGPQGPAGNDGATGPQGPAGATGAPGSDASVTKVNVEAVLTGQISSHSHSGNLIFTYNL